MNLLVHKEIKPKIYGMFNEYSKVPRLSDNDGLDY